MSRRKTRRPRHGKGPPDGLLLVEVLDVLSPGAVARLLHTRIAGRQHWGFVTLGGAGGDFLAEIERTFFAGKNNDDFEGLALALVPGLAVAVFFAHKRWLPAAWLADRLGHDVATLRIRDMVFLGPPGMPEDVGRAVALLLDQLARAGAAALN